MSFACSLVDADTGDSRGWQTWYWGRHSRADHSSAATSYWRALQDRALAGAANQ